MGEQHNIEHQSEKTGPREAGTEPRQMTPAQEETLHARTDTAHSSAHDTARMVARGGLPAVDLVGQHENAAEAATASDPIGNAIASLKSMVSDTAGEAVDKVENLGEDAADYVRKDPIKATGYALGALVGGVVGATVAPELGIAAGIGGLAGAAGLDISIAGTEKVLEDTLGD